MKIYQTIILAFAAFLLVACSAMQPVQTKGPIEVLKNLNEASKTKNVELVKKSVSKGTMNLMEKAAKTQNTTVDELLKKDNGAPFKELPEMRNEKIAGDAATLELKNTTTNDWESVPFVKEDGEWRLALDKYLEEMQKKATENMKLPPPTPLAVEPNAAQPNGEKEPQAAAGKPAKNKK